MTSTSSAEAPTLPGQRGRTVIAERVLRKIAAHDATAIPEVLAVSRVRARQRSRRVDLRLNLAVAYPAPAAATAHRARQRVIAQVQRFTGYEVSTVDITVSYERG